MYILPYPMLPHIRLPEGDESAPPILVDEVSDAPVGRYNAISWKMARAKSGPAAGYSLVIIGTAEKDGQSMDFTINVDEECEYCCGEYVGDERKGILVPPDDELNLAAVGFEPFADGVEVGTILNMTEMHLGHVGEGHCRCECH